MSAFIPGKMQAPHPTIGWYLHIHTILSSNGALAILGALPNWGILVTSWKVQSKTEAVPHSLLPGLCSSAKSLAWAPGLGSYLIWNPPTFFLLLKANSAFLNENYTVILHTKMQPGINIC